MGGRRTVCSRAIILICSSAHAALRDYGRRSALLAAKSALQLELRRLELDAHLVRVRALCAQLLGELPNASLGRHARRGGNGRAHPPGIWRSKPASAKHREFGHNGLFHHAPAELRTGAELLRTVQPAQLDRSLRPPRALLRCSRHALLGASQQALAGRARLPVRRHLEARRLPAEEVVQPGLQCHPSVARADVAKVPGPRCVPALVAEQRGEGMKVPSREASRGAVRLHRRRRAVLARRLKAVVPICGRRAVLARRPFAVVFDRRRRAALARRLQAVVQGRRLTRCARSRASCCAQHPPTRCACSTALCCRA